MIRGAIFDMDGTLLDSMPAWHNVAYNYLQAMGIQAPLDLGDTLFPLTSVESARYVKETFALSQSLDEIRKGMMHQMEVYYSTRPTFKEGAEKLLRDMIQAGIPMTVASSTDGYCLEIALQKLGIYDWFRTVRSCVDIGKTKSEPDIFHLCAQDMGTRPEETWVFEDGLYAVRTAKAAGFYTVGLYDETSHADWPALQQEADLSLQSLAALNLREAQQR